MEENISSHRSRVHELIDQVPEEYVESFSNLVVNLFDNVVDGKRESSQVFLHSSLASVFDIHLKEKKAIKKKLRTSLTFVRKSLEQKKLMNEKVALAKLSCRRYEDKVNVLSERLTEWMKFNKRSGDLMKRLRNRYEEEKQKRLKMAEELKRIKIYAEIEDDKVEEDIDEEEEKHKEEELVLPAPPCPPITGLEFTSRQVIPGFEEEAFVDPDAGSCAPPPPPPPMLGGGPAPPGAPPPPPGFGGGIGLFEPSSPLPSLPSKSTKTVNVRLGKIPKRRLNRTVFKTDRLLEKGKDKFWNDAMKSLLEDKFQVVEKNKKKKSSKSEKDVSKSSTVPLVDSQKTMNASIVCSKITNQEEVLSRLLLSDEWCFSTPEGLETLSRVGQITGMFQPDEKKQIVEKGRMLFPEEEFGKYSPGDRFIVKLFQLSCLDEKLQIFEFLDSYKSVIFEQLKPEMELYLNFCTTLKDSQNFQNFLSLVLVITNFLNKDEIDGSNPSDDIFDMSGGSGSSGVGGKNKPVLGISVRSLINLQRVKNPSDENETLLDVVYGIVVSNHEEMLEFSDNFSDIHTLLEQTTLEEKLNSFKIFRGNVTKLKSKFLVQLKKEKESGELDPNDNIVAILEDLMPTLEQEVSEIQGMFEELDKKVEIISDCYGHPKESIREFFIDLRDFLILLEETKKKRLEGEKKLKRLESRLKRKKEIAKRKRKMNQSSPEKIKEDEEEEEEEESQQQQQQQQQIVLPTIKITREEGSNKKNKPTGIVINPRERRSKSREVDYHRMNEEVVAANDKEAKNIIDKIAMKPRTFNARKKWSFVAKKTREHVRSTADKNGKIGAARENTKGLKQWKVLIKAVVANGIKHGPNSPEPYNIQQQWQFLKDMSVDGSKSV